MRRLAIARRSLFELRWQILGYGVGLGLYGTAMVWLFPAFEDTLRGVDYPPELLEFFGGAGDMSRPTTFISTEYMSFAPLVLVIYAIVASTGLLAGEEGRGSLESILAQPASRTRFFLEKLLAFLAGAAIIGIIIAVLMLLSFPFVDLHGDLTLSEMWLGTASMLPLVCFFGGLGFLLGAVAPSRGLAAGIATVLVIVAFLIASFARIITSIEWMQYLSPYYYGDTATVLDEGVVWWHQGVLLGAGILLFAFAMLAFTGREIGAGVWQLRAWMPARAR
jgi:putative exporter of polyketide antibiotics